MTCKKCNDIEVMKFVDWKYRLSIWNELRNMLITLKRNRPEAVESVRKNLESNIQSLAALLLKELDNGDVSFNWDDEDNAHLDTKRLLNYGYIAKPRYYIPMTEGSSFYCTRCGKRIKKEKNTKSNGPYCGKCYKSCKEYDEDYVPTNTG